jgi:excisionase family DNA binding protein
MNREETLLSTAQAAERLGVTVRGVQKMIEEGRLKALKIGRDYVISPHALEGITRQPAGRPPKVKAEGSPNGEKPKKRAPKKGKK